MTVGERIRDRRIALGLSQEDLALLMGYSGKSTVCKTETGGNNVTTDKIKKYADALGCSFGDLMGWGETEKAAPTIENAGLLADIMHDAKMVEELKKVMAFDQRKKEALFSYIDFLSSSN